MSKPRAGKFPQFLVLVLLWSLLLQGFAGFAAPVAAIEPASPFGFEGGLLGWTTGGSATASPGGNYQASSFIWGVYPYETMMGVLQPSGSIAFSTIADTLGISGFSRTYIETRFPGITNSAYAYTDLTLAAGESFTMSWNYVATDYAPFDDASFCSLVNLGNAASLATVDGHLSQVAILGSTVSGSGNYATGDFGSTGWQTVTFEANEAGTYRLGFTVFNLSDTINSPYLFLDKEPGTTLKNGTPFAPIARDPNAPPPPVQTVPTVTTNEASAITSTTCTLSGSVTGDGLATVTQRGFVFGTSPDPTVDDIKMPVMTAGVGSYTMELAGLTPGATYHYRAYAINEIGVGYGADMTLGTLPAAPVAIQASHVTGSSFTARWNAVTGATGYTLDVSTNSGFTQMVSGYNGLAIGPVLSYTVSGLSPVTPYYYRVRVTTANGTSQSSNTIGVSTTQLTQTITFPALPAAVYGDADIAPGATASSGLPVTYQSSNTNVAQIVDGKIRIIGVGSAVITASQDGNTAWDNAPVQQRTLTVSPRPITVTANGSSKVYGDADPALSYTVTTGTLVGSDTLTGTLSRAPGEDVGHYAIGQGTLSAGSNYVLTFNPGNFLIATRSITITADAKTKVYGDPDPALTWSVTAGTLADGDTITGSLVRTAGEDAVTYGYAIGQGTLSAGDNYAITYQGAVLSITRRTLVIQIDEVSKTYGEADPELTWSFVSGSVLEDDPFTCELGRIPGEQVGAYFIYAETLVWDHTNYTIMTYHKNLLITPRAITVTAAAEGKTYGDEDPALDWTITSGTLVTGDSLSGVLTRAAGEDVGSYAIGQGSLSGGANYALSFVPGTFTISQRPLTVTADAKSKVYGTSDPALTWTLTAGTLVDDDAITGDLSRVAGEDVGNYAIGRGTVSAGDNYAITFESAPLAITQRPITVTANNRNKTYGYTDPLLTWSVTAGSLVSGDAITGDLARVSGEDIGRYAILQGTLTAGDNYAITYVPAEIVIAARPITITANDRYKTYGVMDPVLTWGITAGSLVDGDAVTGALARVSGEQVGSYVILQGTLDAGENYAITYVPGEITIGARPLTVTADARSKVYGGTDPELSWALTSGTLLEGDAITGALVRVAGESAGSYAIGQGSLSAGDNYAITYVPADFVIATRSITVAAHAASKIYGDADPALTWHLVEGELFGGDTITGDLSRTAGEHAGNYAIGQGSLSAGDNYAITFVPADLVIASRSITVTADARSKVYGNPDPALTWSLSGGTLVDGDAITGALSRTAGEDIGNYAIGQGSLTAGDDYAITLIPAHLSITRRPLSIYIDAKEKTYGDPDPELTWRIPEGMLVAGDSFDFGLIRQAGEQVGYRLILPDRHIEEGNYSLSIYYEYLRITPRPITVTADAESKVYGDPDPDLGWTVTSGALVSGDVLTGILARESGEDVGSYAISQGALTGGDNYTITFEPAELSISQRAITVTAGLVNKIYGDADPELTWAITEGELAYEDALAGGLARVDGEDVGTYAIGQGTLDAGDNYILSFVPAELWISQRPITVSADAVSKHYGDPDPVLTWTLTAGSLIGEDVLSGDLLRAAGENAGHYAIGQGTLDAGANYAITFEPADLTIAPYLEELEHGAVQNGTDADNDGSLHYIPTARAGFGFAYWSDGTTLFSTHPELVDPAGGIGAYTPVIWPVGPATDMRTVPLAPGAPTTVSLLNGAVRMILPASADLEAVLSITPVTAFDETLPFDQTDALPEGLAPASRFFTMLRSENLTGMPIRIEIDLALLDTNLSDDETASLVLYHWDEGAGAWERTSILDQGIDEAAGILWAELDHFSTYGLFYEADVADTGDTGTSVAGLMVLGGGLLAGSLVVLLRKRRLRENGETAQS